MSPASTHLLQYFREEYQKTGKKTFSTQDIFDYLNDFKEYDKVIDELLRHKMIAKSTYVNCFDLLKP